MSEIIVAVDGPAGSGKSSVSKEAARRLGYAYLDTGAAYRALAWHCLDEGIDVENADAVAERARSFDYATGMDPDHYFVRVGGEDITPDIREPRVTAVVSAVARVSEVREALNAMFRRMMSEHPRPGVIAEGRDITTVVAPDAPVRVLLTATEEARIARRSAEVSAQTTEATAQQLASRDRQDSRVVDFMTAADGVITIDSTDIDFEQTVQALIDTVRSGLSTEQ
ncbi:cytidylate kinase [Microcella putealis]|uniref:Cytidylate kinase n=1 Tax=Microcella putealis TaxID=337005 RepID=A0A4Q7LVJ4_9MICO|nr:(d)CMP kinase [Microcella putealis]RZS57709.1 cytidylate kinase [Microcella putealis]TQM24776.1 cytidylate kinase [Microcella putealis]